MESALGYALLGLLRQAPRSGYDLRKAFASTPLSHFSDSPGAIYPALARLRRRFWIEPVPGQGRSRRRRRLFRLTAKGRRAFLVWLRRPVSRADVVSGMDRFMVRFAFMGEALRPKDVVGFLTSLQREIEGHVAELRQFVKAAAPGMPLTGRLALESGIESYRGEGRWARRAAEQVRREGRKR